MKSNLALNKTKLKSIGDVLSGFAFDSGYFNYKTGMPIVRIRDIISGKTSTYYDGPFDRRYLIKNGDYLIGMDGEFNITKWSGGEALLNQRVCKLFLDSKKVYPKYVYYLMHRKLKEIELRTPYVTVKHISTKQILDIDLLLPPLPIQRKVASILDKAESAREKRREANRLTDELLKSAFIEMFGNPIKNPKKWQFYKVKDIAAKEKNSIKAGPFGSSLKKEYYVKKGYKIYGQEQVIRDDLTYGDYYINEERYRTLENNKIKKGDILISLVGTFGKISIVPDVFEPGIINPRLMKITLNKKIIIPNFFKSLLISEGMKAQIENFSHGGTMGIVNVEIMKNIKIPVPPITLQQKFAELVQKVEKLKEKQRDSEKELDNLFNSLMQRAFRGEII
jgi:type I restriction enzyme S subunit